MKLCRISSLIPKSETASTAIHARRIPGARATSVANSPNTEKWISLSMLTMLGAATCPRPEATTTMPASVSGYIHIHRERGPPRDGSPKEDVEGTA